MKIFKVILVDFNTIKIFVDSPSSFVLHKLRIINGENELCIKTYSISENYINIYINEEINIKLFSVVLYENIETKIIYYPLFNTKNFHNKFYHPVTLGAIYTKDYTTFRLWSPPASSVKLIIYENGEPKENESKRTFSMKESSGLWEVSLTGDFEGLFYTFEVTIYNTVNEAIDPYAYAVGINGIRGAIIDLGKTNPIEWDKDSYVELEGYTDAIIYEASIRDISSHPYSGIKNKGKFLALTEDNTNYNGTSTVLNHLKELGITHLQLLPIFDFSYKSTDEKNPYKYNWGYDPQNYNVPEGSYSTNPYNPVCRIYELKKMIMSLHKNNVGINMDVVFNHVFEYYNSCFEKIFPGYYFRHNDDGSLSNGSGCGNDIASERSMVRKFIVDSIVYWTKEYHIDGFRFDLMGLIDIDTMDQIREELYSINKNIMLYGEGWNLSTALNENKKSIQENASKLQRIGFFNDKFRDTVKGSIFSIYDKGFATGKPNLEEEIKKCILGYIDYNDRLSGVYLSPEQSINYVSCHDNHTLWDKINLSCNDDSLENKKKMAMLCSSILLLSQGVPFLHCGMDFCRTKNGEENSFNKSDHINWINWYRKAEFLDVFEHYKKIIKLRKEHSAFRIKNADDIKKHLIFIDNLPKNTAAFMLKNHANNDVWKDILLIFNANKEPKNLNLPTGHWKVYVNSNNNSLCDKCIVKDIIYVDKISTTILYKL